MTTPDVETYQATLMVTDRQFGLLTGLVEKEIKRLEQELKKPATSLKKRWEIEGQLENWQAIRKAMNENVW